jgi:hypothetical protein
VLREEPTVQLFSADFYSAGVPAALLIRPPDANFWGRPLA